VHIRPAGQRAFRALLDKIGSCIFRVRQTVLFVEESMRCEIKAFFVERTKQIKRPPAAGEDGAVEGKSSDSFKRLLSEIHLGACCPSDADGVTARPVGEDIWHWKGLIHGPKDTPYEGGSFVIDIQLLGYPFRSPTLKFETPIWNPYICPETGTICAFFGGTEWSPALTLRTSLTMIQSMLGLSGCPEQENVVATEYRNNFLQWSRTARAWTEKYAYGSVCTCACDSCQAVKVAFTMVGHARLGQDSRWSLFSELPELVEMIISFVQRPQNGPWPDESTCRSAAEKNFLQDYHILDKPQSRMV